MGVARGMLMTAVLATSGCFPREAQSIGAVDPINSIPAIQNAAQTNNRAAIPALVNQLDNDDPAIRFYAFGALNRMTGNSFDYHFYDDVDQRRPALERWRNWLKQRKT
jgi:hypothetical protein